jgi:hypothetical protein
MASRKLNALGYTLGPKLAFRGVEAIPLKNQRGECLLLVSSVFYGPSWPQIFNSVEHLVPTPNLITLGNTPSVLIFDTPEARGLIKNLPKMANNLRGKEVHLEDVGFVEVEERPKPNLRALTMPLVSAVCVIALGVFWSIGPEPSQSVDATAVESACAVDSNASDFETWLIESLGGEHELAVGNEIQKSTAIGQLNIVVESTIGSAAKVTGAVVCSDGRQRAINHRVDTSGSGAVLELGQ